jgi:predicted amidohydrolase YtcJ
MEADRGSLEPGKRADLAVLTADPLSVPAAKIRDITSVLTVVAGRTGHDALTAAGSHGT